MNMPIEEGTVFQEDQMPWTRVPAINQYDFIISYTDPSYKNTEKSDYKATVLIGKKGLNYYIIKAWVDRVSLRTMFEWIYDCHEIAKDAAITHHIESNFLQDLIWGELNTLATDKGFMLPIVGDSRKKTDKFQRIEALQPLFERGVVHFNASEQGSPGMQRLRSQFLAFEKGSRANDDGPDAVEGGIQILNSKSVSSQPVKVGRRKKSRNHF